MPCRTRTQYTVEQKTDSAIPPDIDLVRWTPEIHPAYRWRDNLSPEVDYTDEHSTTTRPGNQDASQQHFFDSGDRWDI